MTKAEFLSALKAGLSALPDQDIKERISFYSEMIDDRMEDGFSEEDAVAMFGDINELTAQIIENTPMTRLVKKKVSTHRRSLGVLEIVFLILGSPIWLSLLVSAAAVVISLYLSLWSVVISLWAVMVSLAVCGVVGVIAGGIYAVAVGVLPGIAVLGAGLVCAGIAIFAFFGCKLAVSALIWLTKKLWLGIKISFAGKEIK